MKYFYMILPIAFSNDAALFGTNNNYERLFKEAPRKREDPKVKELRKMTAQKSSQ